MEKLPGPVISGRVTFNLLDIELQGAVMRVKLCFSLWFRPANPLSPENQGTLPN